MSSATRNGDGLRRGGRRRRLAVPARLDKLEADIAPVLERLPQGATVLIGGFGEVGVPTTLIAALVESGARELTVVANNAGVGSRGIAELLRAGQVSRLVCSYPRSAGATVFERLYNASEVELELVPQGTLAERLRAGAAGNRAFYSPVGAGTLLAEGKELRSFDGVDYLLENAIRGDLALVRAFTADRKGNLRYRATARNLNPMMAMAADCTFAEAQHVLPAGEYLDPDDVHTPGIFVDQLMELQGSVDE